jgi:hypothetical protein
MLKQVSLTAIALCASLAMSSQAATIPYPDIGTPAPANTFVADADGEITAYFFATSAGHTSRIGLWVNGSLLGGYGLENHSSSYGDSYTFGNVSAGDSLVFELQVLNTNGSWYTFASSNSDGLNHAYSTSWGGDATVPAGTYIGFEDLAQLGDIDYNDHQFVFTNVRNTTVPEPLSLALFGLGVAALGFARKRAA